MKLIPETPVTIHAARHAPRWFPALYRHTDGSYLMYIEHGYDSDFSPIGKWRSTDGGRSWMEEEENVPRGQIVHSFADGTLLELDAYGFLDPKTPHTYCLYGAWSTPGATGTIGHSAFYHGAENRGEDWLDREEGGVLRTIFTVHSPSIAPHPLTKIQHGYPHFPWWSLINRLHSPDVKGSDVMMGINITDTAELGGKLLAVGYAPHKDDASTPARTSVFCYQSDDDGHAWREIGRGARLFPEKFDAQKLLVSYLDVAFRAATAKRCEEPVLGNGKRATLPADELGLAAKKDGQRLATSRLRGGGFHDAAV